MVSVVPIVPGGSETIGTTGTIETFRTDLCDLRKDLVMFTKPRITLGLPDHPRCQAIIDGKVGIEGYELEVDPHFVSSGERHYKYLHGEWDVGEVSAASLLRAIEKGQQLLAIPVFFERGPRQRNFYYSENHLKH